MSHIQTHIMQSCLLFISLYKIAFIVEYVLSWLRSGWQSASGFGREARDRSGYPRHVNNQSWSNRTTLSSPQLSSDKQETQARDILPVRLRALKRTRLHPDGQHRDERRFSKPRDGVPSRRRCSVFYSHSSRLQRGFGELASSDTSRVLVATMSVSTEGEVEFFETRSVPVIAYRGCRPIGSLNLERSGPRQCYQHCSSQRRVGRSWCSKRWPWRIESTGWVKGGEVGGARSNLIKKFVTVAR
jgi:hypothetical protein